MAKYSSTRYTDLEDPFTVFKQMTDSSFSGKTAITDAKNAAPRLRLTKLQPLRLKASVAAAGIGIAEERKEH